MTHCWQHIGCFGVWIFPEYCYVHKSLSYFKAKTLSNSTLYLLQASSGPWHVCIHTDVYIYMQTYVYMHIGIYVFVVSWYS